MKNLVEKLKNSELVAVPTETVYGLACNGLDESAVEKVYEIKGRPEIKPLSLMVYDSSWIERMCVDVPHIAFNLAEKYWPGPLTIILKSKDIIPSIVRAGGSTIGLRCPDNSLTLQLIKEADFPLAAPSANPSGLPSAKCAEDVVNYFGDKVNILDGGRCSLGIESSIVDLSSFPYSVIRVGALSEGEIIDSIVDSIHVVGITGQSGSGKSLAITFIEQYCNVGIIDCDKVYHDLLLSNNNMLSELKYAFPGCFTNEVLDRKKLASEVFSNKNLLILLNSITHKYVVDEVDNMLKYYALNGKTVCIIEAIELISSHLSDKCDKVIGIVSDEKTKVDRLVERDGLTIQQAYERLKAQKPIEYYIDNCDVIINNNGSIEDFINNVRKEIELNG